VTFPNVAEALKEFCSEKQTKIMVVMGLHIEGECIQRDIAVFHCAAPEGACEVCLFVLALISY
jgi:hypothetical protein